MAIRNSMQGGMLSRTVATIHALVALSIVSSTAVGIWTARSEYPHRTHLKLHRRAPELELPSLSQVGNVGGVGKQRRNVTVIAFYSVWNPDSTGSFILLEKLRREAPDAIDILAVNVDRPEDAATAASLLQQLGSSAEVLWDRRGDALNAYHVRRLPAWFLLDADGILLARGWLPTLDVEGLNSAIAAKRS